MFLAHAGILYSSMSMSLAHAGFFILYFSSMGGGQDVPVPTGGFFIPRKLQFSRGELHFY
jgi:hypothetical protein